MGLIAAGGAIAVGGAIYLGARAWHRATFDRRQEAAVPNTPVVPVLAMRPTAAA